MMKWRFLHFVLRLAIGAVFFVSGLNKIRQPYLFLNAVNDYQMFHIKTSLWVAVLIPWFELVLGTCLICGFFLGASYLGIAGLGALFTGVLISALHRGLVIQDCGCSLAGPIVGVTWMTVLRPVLVVVLSIWGFVHWLKQTRAPRDKETIAIPARPLTAPAT